MAINFPLRLYIKDPTAVLDYSCDWSQWLASSNSDTIMSSSWTINSYDPTAIDAASPELTSENQTNTTTTATIWLAAGIGDLTYIIANEIVTNNGRTNVQSFLICVQAC